LKTISVNGEPIKHIDGETVAGLLERLRFVFPLVVVMVNRKVVMRENFESTLLKDGANVEVIHLTSGG
jgi:sulfur carrier protein